MSKCFSISDFEGLSPIDPTREDDLFITSASFEDRATSVIKSLSDDYSAKRGIIYVNEELIQDGNKTIYNLGWIEKELKEYCKKVQVATGSWLEQGQQLDALKQTLSDRSEKKSEGMNVTLDSTTFNRETLMILLSLLYNCYPKSNTRIAYVSPKEHGAWLSRGHKSIRNILGFTGLHKSHKPTVLILLTGFESHRAMKIVKEFEPSKLLLGVGDPPTQEQFLERNQQEQRMVEKHYDTNGFEFPADDIRGSYEVIDDLIEEYSPNYNVVIAPMSTKLSTIGAWRAARDNQEVQVTYSIPGEYNTDEYSIGEDSLYLDTLPI